MGAPLMDPPISVPIRAGPAETLSLLRTLAVSLLSLRRGVKSVLVEVIPEDPVGLDIKNHFLDVYPNLRELILIGFDYLVGCTPDPDSDSRHSGHWQNLCGGQPSFEPGISSLRGLTLLAQHGTVPHSMQRLFELTRLTPHLSVLELLQVTFQPEHQSGPKPTPCLPDALDVYCFLVNQDAGGECGNSRGWTAPFAGAMGPRSLTIYFSDTRDLEELSDHEPERRVDLSYVRYLCLIVDNYWCMPNLFDYDRVLVRCSRLRDLEIRSDQVLLIQENALLRLLSQLRGPLRSLTIITVPHRIRYRHGMVHPATDQSIAKALSRQNAGAMTIRIRRIELVIMDAFDAQLPAQCFPVLTAFCRSLRINFVARVQDNERLWHF